MIVLRNKEFARKDYDGYSESQQKTIKAERNKLAKEIRKKRGYNKNLLDEIDKIAEEDRRKYVLGGEGKNKEFAPENIEDRRNQRKQRLYEPSIKNREEIEKYLEKGKKRIKNTVGKKKIPIKAIVKEEEIKKLNIPYKKIGKYALVGTAVIGGTVGGIKLAKSRKDSKKREEAKNKILEKRDNIYLGLERWQSG